MLRYIIFGFCLVFSGPLLAQAQIGDSGVMQNASIVLKPAYPAPYSTFSASLDDYALPGQTTSIFWRINGSVIPGYNNRRTIELTTMGAGEQMTIEAILELSDKQNFSLVKSFTPIYLDIVVEPQTRTPAFYLGRGLPSIESQVNLRAIINGVNIPSQNLVYSWQVNDQFIDGGGTRGRNSALITVPRGRTFLVNLIVTRLDGQELIKQTLRLPSVEPEIHFYEKTALYGLNPKALSALNITGNSATVTAEPYHLAIETYNQPGLLEWEVDGKKSTVSNNNPYEITLARPAGEGRGSSQVNFHVRNLEKLLQGVEDGLRVNF